jgi:outer membrane cobalamin receptor
MVLIFLGSVNDLFAQSDTTKKLKEVKVNTSTIPQVQVIVPSQSISANDFIHYNAFNVADAIRDFSGVIIKDYGGIGGLKTVSVRGLGANHTSILYDGIQINDAENGQVDLGKLNVNGIQRITLYNAQPPNILQTARAFAAASVLSIETIKPNLSAEKPYLVTAGIKAGSFGLINPTLQWQQRLSNNWSFVINGYTENANGKYKYDVDNGVNITQQTRTSADIAARQFDGALYWTKSDSNKFNLHINFYNSDRGLPGSIVLYSGAIPADRLYNRDIFIQSGYEHIWKHGLHLLLNTKLSRNYLRYLNPNYNNAVGKLDQQFIQRELYQSAALSYHITTNWEVAYAADLSINDMNKDFNVPNAFAAPIRMTLLNVLSSNLNLGKLHLQGSILNTNINETVKSGTVSPGANVYSPTLVASVLPFDNSTFQVRAFYKHIFRTPTFNDLYYGGIGNLGLKPEYARQYDLGLSYTKSLNGFLSYVTFTTDAYYNNVTNKIVFVPKDAYNGSIQNFGKVDIEGLDVGIKTQANLSDKWKASLIVNYTYQLALNVTDPTSSIYLNQLPYTPKNIVACNTGIDYGALGLYYNQLISSARYYANDNISADFMPEYTVSDVSLVYHFLSKKLPVTTSIEVNNIFNKSYAVVQDYPMPGRSFRFSFQITI